jgi:hypothetical protein
VAQLFDEFHDAELVAIEIDRHARSMMLRFASGSSATKTIGLSGVSHFRAVDLITQNVVSRIIVSSLDRLSLEDIRRWIGWVTSLSDGESFSTPEGSAEIERRISNEEYILLVFVPSWGAEIVIIAKSYSVN